MMHNDSFPKLVATLLCKKCLPWMACESYQNNNSNKNEVDIDRQLLLNADFVRFLLHFLRESSAPVLRRSSTRSLCSTDEQTQNPTDLAPSRQHGDSYNVSQKMSTPKVRDGIVTPKTNRSVLMPGGPPCPRQTGRDPGFSVRSEPHKQHSRNNRWNLRSKSKQLSLCDFISPEAGQGSNNCCIKKSQKKGRRAQLTSASEGKQKFGAGVVSLTQQEHSFLYNRKTSDVKSPINPLFSEASRNLSFNIEEDFPTLSSVPHVVTSKTTRRIKPTAIMVTSNAKPGNSPSLSACSERDVVETNGHSETRNPFSPTTPVKPSAKDSLTMERHLLLKMKTQMKVSNLSLEEKCLKTSTKSFEEISPVKKVSKEPEPLHVLESDKVERLASLYAFFINSYLVPNIITELQFIIHLLTIVPCDPSQDKIEEMLSFTGSLHHSSESSAEVEIMVVDADLLSTLSNCIHFAVCVLQALTSSGIITILAQPALSLLAENSRIQLFQPALPSEILSLVEKLDLKEKELSGESFWPQDKAHSMSSVLFEAETDDRSNFPSDRSFHAFRKHRDLFYAIVREYEEKKHEPNFDIHQHLAVKVKNLVSQVKTSGTYAPFVRLFVSQMLQEATQYGGVIWKEDFSNADTNDLSHADSLTLLRQGDPERFRRLQSRFFTASSSSHTTNAKDVLSDKCYFYKEFVLCADSYNLNVHLSNELRNRISDIERQQVQQILDDALAETASTVSVSSALSSVISMACIIGRFLGFITFEPYNAGETHPRYDAMTLIYATSALDEALSHEHELVTVPWVTEYLKSAKMSLIPLTNEAEAVAERLFSVYRRHTVEKMQPLNTGDLFLSLMVSNVLDVPFFPEEYFYQLSKKHLTPKCTPKTVQINPIRENKLQEVENVSLDNSCSRFVNLSAIHDSHPGLREIRSSLASFKSGTNKFNQCQQPSRKIKPNTERDKEDTIAQKKEKQLQCNLEEHFFRGQPSSLKRTVAFVAERCASNCVKRIRSISMLEICDEAEKLFLQWLPHKETKEGADNYVKINLTRQVVTEMKSLAKERMHKESEEFCDKAVPQCLQDLTSCETADGVLKLATVIAKKRAVASVHAWLTTRLDELVSVSVKARLTKVFSNITVHGESLSIPIWQCADEEGDILQEIKSVSSLLQAMKEYTVKLAFEGSKADSLPSATIYPYLPEKLTETHVARLLGLARFLLFQESEISTNHETAKSMRSLLLSSSHLKTCVIVAARELAHRAQLFFQKPVNS